mmetsp:Transcript_66314/g.107572  ORF Transcript_66314/g.107572 Transcript_66314/m.107572 type:complete len:219 (-) Transcript_66314:390-1046(-)
MCCFWEPLESCASCTASSLIRIIKGPAPVSHDAEAPPAGVCALTDVHMSTACVCSSLSALPADDAKLDPTTSSTTSTRPALPADDTKTDPPTSSPTSTRLPPSLYRRLSTLLLLPSPFPLLLPAAPPSPPPSSGRRASALLLLSCPFPPLLPAAPPSSRDARLAADAPCATLGTSATVRKARRIRQTLGRLLCFSISATCLRHVRKSSCWCEATRSRK